MPDSPLLLTKVRPPSRRPDALYRSRLVDALLENSDRKLLLVIAPAGYGKTTLLTDFAEQSPAAVAWLTLDAADRDPRGFIEGTVSALQQVSPTVGAPTLAALAGAVEIELRAAELARTLAADVGQNLSGVCILTLDDFHEVNESPAVTSFLDELLRVLPDNLRILLAGRTLPNLTVSRLAVERHLFGFSESELRFLPAEVTELVRLRYGADLDEAQAQFLTDRSEGWIAGLLLSIHGLLDSGTSNLAYFGDEQRLLNAYLSGEAYDRQPPEMRQFLLASSALRVLTDASCAAVLGPGDWMAWLGDAQHANLFITRLGGPEPAYRYHPLFREFLQGRLRREQPELFRGLHLRAARYLAGERDWPAAIEHYHEAQAQTECAQLVARIAPELEREGRWYLLARTIDELPEELRSRNPALLVSRARAAGLTGDLKGAETMARQATAVCREMGESGSLAWALQVLGNALRRLGRTEEAIETLRTARMLAPEDEALVATVRRDLAGCYGVKGDFAAAAIEFGAAREYFARAGNTYEAARAAYGVGAALARMGRVDEACVHYGEALDRWRGAGDHGGVAMALNNIGYIRSFQGDYDEAQALLSEGLEEARTAGHRVVEANLHDSLGGLLLGKGDIPAAADSFRTGMELAQDTGDLWSTTAMMEGAGLCALFQGDVESATRWFAQGTSLAERQQSEYRRAQLAVDDGLVLLQNGEIGRALATLTGAEETLLRLQARRDLVRTRLWLAHAHYRRGDLVSAGAYFQEAAREASALNVPALLDLPARWDEEAFAAFPAGEFEEVRASVLERLGRTRPAHLLRIVPQPDLPAYRVYSFGRARVADTQGGAIDWPRGKARELFFYLLHQGTTQSHRAAADIWPHASPAHAKANLYSAVYGLRRATHAEFVVAEDRTYGLRADLIVSDDVVEFDRLYVAIREEKNAARRRLLMEQLVALHTGPLLESIEADWAATLRRTYEMRYLDTLESLVAAYAVEEAWSECLSAALQGITIDPDCQDFYAYAGRAYRALGKPWAAARLARRARERPSSADAGRG
ncbi:MAG: tetratricopeptide repeat protein [Dehalococcoidia bacterium]